jgi:hypothetical protein
MNDAILTLGAMVLFIAAFAVVSRRRRSQNRKVATEKLE